MHQCIKVFDVKTGRELLNLPTTRRVSEVFCAVDPTGHWLVYTPDDTRRVSLVNLDELKVIGDRPEGVVAIAHSGDRFAWSTEHGLFVTGRDGTEILPLGAYWQSTTTPSFSQNGRLLAWGTAEGEVAIADIAEITGQMEALGARKQRNNSFKLR